MRSVTGVLVFSLTLLTCAVFASPPASAATCASLTSLSLPNTTITLAQPYAAGDPVTGTTKAPVGLCRVAGTVKPGPNSNVHFEVWIPTDGSWNGKYQQVGNGGFAGSIQHSRAKPTMAPPVHPAERQRLSGIPMSCLTMDTAPSR